MTTREERQLPPVNVPPTGVVAKTSVAPPAARPKQLTIPPPGLEELEAGYAQRPEGAFAPEAAIDEQIAFLGAVTAAAANPLQQTYPGVAAGGVAALAIAIDAAWPATADRVARRRA